MKEQQILPSLRTRKLVVNKLPNELLIYDLENNRAYCLNETAQAIMEQCDGKTTILEATQSIGRQLKTKMTEEMIWFTIDQLKNAKLIDQYTEIPIDTSGITRRSLLRSATALGISIPLITSLVAPIAANAQSTCVTDGQPCTDDPDPCCPGLVCINTESGPTGFTCVGSPM